MKKSALMSLGGALVLASLPAAAQFEYHGYYRAGVGVNSAGGDQVCFSMPGAATDMRLGNECDYSYEFTFQKKFNTDQEGPKWDATVMLGGYEIFPNHNLDVGVQQMFVSGTDLGDGVLKGATVWAGKRYYERVQMDVNDLFLLRADGDGFGVEGLDLGFGRGGYAMMYRSRGDNNTGTLDHLFKLTDIQSNPGGNLSLYLSFKLDTSSDQKDQNGNVVTPANEIENGWQFSVIHRQQFDKVSNLLGLQYGKGSLSNLELTSDGAGKAKGSKVVRLADEAGISLNDQTRLSVLGLYQRTDDGSGNTTTWYELGLRPTYTFNDIASVSWDVGYDILKPKGSDTRKLLKNTLALELRNGGNAVPRIRFFYTFAKWNDAVNQASANGPVFGWASGTTNPFAGETSGSSFGAQGEVWF